MPTRTHRLGLLLVALTLLAACGSAPPASSPQPTSAPTVSSPSGAADTAPTATTVAGMATMDGMGHGGMGSDDAPYDARFIDSMIVHHEGAIAMANQALAQAERPEIKTLATAIVAAQEAEVAQLKAWRKAWYPDLPPTKGMGMDMGTMSVADDAGTPFDQRFIEAMVPHHEGAIAMAQDAQRHAEHPEIKELARNIVAAQEGEIAQMKQWRAAWFGK